MPNSPIFNILVLDTNTNIHNEITQAATAIGLNDVCTSLSSEEAQQAISDGFKPNIVVMEINLGGAAGLNFMRQIRAGKTAAKSDVPIIIMSQGLTPDIAFQACDIGFEHFIRKPFSADAIQKRLRVVRQNPRRFVVGSSYFGPDRRDQSNSAPHEGGERRENKIKSAVQSKKPPLAGAPLEGVAPKAKSEDFALVDEPVRNLIEKASLVETVPENAVEASAKVKEQLKTAPSLPERIKGKPEVQAIAKEPEVKEKIEVVAPPEPKGDGRPDLASMIAETLEIHATWLNTQGREGEKANFADQDLAGADLSQANLASANLRNADLQDANLYQANLFDADLRGAKLSGAILNEADLHNAKLRHANLKATILNEAGLRGADLAGANLSGAQMAGVDFKDANFLSTDICGADLLGVNLVQRQIDKATGDGETKLPPGLRLEMAN